MIRHLFAFLFVLLLASISQAQVDGYKRYQIESATIEFEISGTHSGSETLYFDHFGKREAKFSTVTIMELEQSTLTLILGDHTHSIDLKTKRGARMPTPMLSELLQFADGTDITQAAVVMMREMGGVMIESEEVAGRMCDVWKLGDMGSRIWLWEGIALKTIVEFAGMTIMVTAVSIDTESAIDASKFKIPDGVEMSDIDPALLPGHE